MNVESPSPEPPAGPPPEAPLAHFSQGGLHSGGAAPPMLAAMAPLIVLFLLGVLPLLLLIWLGNWPWVPLELRVAAVSLLVIGSLWFVGRALWRAYIRGTSPEGLAFKLDEDARVNVICWPDQRDTLEPLGDVAFEPEQFRAIVPDRLPERLRGVGRSAKPGQVPGQVSGQIQGWVWGLLWPLIYLPIMLHQYWISGVVAVLAVGVLLWFMRKPTYLRVVPGRADLLRFPLFGGAGSTPDVETFDLRSSPVRLDLKQGVLKIGPWTEDQLKRGHAWNDPLVVPEAEVANEDDVPAPEWRTIRLRGVPQREAAARALYLASISTADHGPLPEAPNID